MPTDTTRHPGCISLEALRLTAELPSVREKRTERWPIRWSAGYSTLQQAIVFFLEDHPNAPGAIQLRTALLRATAYTMTDDEFDDLLEVPITDPTAMTDQDVADELLDQVDDDRAEHEAVA